MKRIFSILFLTIVAFATLSGQQVSIYKISLDSLVSKMGSYSTGRIYFVNDTSNAVKFTFNSTEKDFLEAAEKAIAESGFSITKKDGNMFILKGVGLTSALPSGYFEQKMADDSDNKYIDALSEDAKIASFQNKVYEIGRKENDRGGNVFLSGFIKNVRTGEPLTGISVYNEKAKAYAQTDEFGFYKILLPSGENTLKASGFLLEDIALNLLVYETGSLDIIMKDKVLSLNEATVSAESSNNRRSNQMGVELIRIGRIKQVPSVFGEPDVLKIIITLPGVKSVGEASGGFNVRGGASDQNLILFNDGTIYNPTHLFGMFSAFNPDVVKDVELYKSSIPAQYGGRLSSVLEIKGREGNGNKVTGSLGIGLITARGHIEGPIGAKTRFIVGARATYSDWMLKLLPESSGYNQGTASFYDINASVSHRFNSKNTIYAYGYYSSDRFKFSIDTSYRYSNLNASIKWRSNFSQKHSMVLTAGYDQYGYDTYDTDNPSTSYNLRFSIQQAFLKLNFKSLLSANHTLSYGLNSTYYYLRPGMLMPYDILAGTPSLVEEKILPSEEAVESALFISDTWKISEKFSTDLGIRYSFFTNLAPFKYYGGPEFRISAKYLATDRLTLKAGFNSMRQYIQMLSNTTSMSPTDIWKLSDADIRPQSGWQGALALYSNHFENKIELSLETYYKRMDNYLDYKSGAVLIMNENLHEDVVETRGRAYGVEFMVKKPLGKLNGWISYTYSKTELQEKGDRGVNTINRGEWYPAPYDKPHDVKFIGNYKFTHRYSISLNVDYSTGRPVTIPVSRYIYGGGERLFYSDRNEYRIPDYFRMDAALNIEPGHNLTRLTHFSITIGVYNVTGRKNAYSVYYNTDGGTGIQGYMLTIFGAPIPYINLNMKF